MMEISDSELLMLTLEKNEDAEDILNERYKKIIKCYINKHINDLKLLNIDVSELYSSCFEVYQYAIVNYINTSNASFYTYVTLLIERKIQKEIIKKIRKNKKFKYTYLDDENFKKGVIINQNEQDPLEIICEEEHINFIKSVLNEKYSKADLYIFSLYVEGFTCKELSSILNLNYDNLTKKIKRMKKGVLREYHKMFG